MNKQENALQKKAKKNVFSFKQKTNKKINLTWLTYQPQKLTDRRQNISISEIQWISQGISYSWAELIQLSDKCKTTTLIECI